MTVLYHFTDTARLPWIILSGELRPGRNKIGGFPDPDFLWATPDPRGDMTASADRGEYYRSGKVRHVRFTLDVDGFIPWSHVPTQFPQWTPAYVAMLEGAAQGKSSPSTWWCRAAPIPCEGWKEIETRSYQDNRWLPFREPEIEAESPDWLSVMIGQKRFWSREFDAPHGAAGYQVRVAT